MCEKCDGKVVLSVEDAYRLQQDHQREVVCGGMCDLCSRIDADAATETENAIAAAKSELEKSWLHYGNVVRDRYATNWNKIGRADKPVPELRCARWESQGCIYHRDAVPHAPCNGNGAPDPCDWLSVGGHHDYNTGEDL